METDLQRCNINVDRRRKTCGQNNSTDLDLFFNKLSAFYGVKLYRRDTLFVFDEVQLYPKARQLTKYLVADGRFDYLLTGSLITIKKNVETIVIPSEEESLTMYPLDFEEFLWAVDKTDTTINAIIFTNFLRTYYFLASLSFWKLYTP